MWTHARYLLGSAVCCMALAASGTSGAIDPGTADRYFHEAQALSLREGGRLWGVSLYGPMLFVDPGSRMVVANGPDALGVLQQKGSVWEGRLPAPVGLANTVVDWSGTHWTMVIWPLPADRHAREKLMMHECFHRIQKGLGLEVQDRPCGHLDSKGGRIWLQLEWRALGEALVSHGPARRRAVQDALLFRGHRRALFKGASEAGKQQELNEGLAEYTGIRASARSTAQAITDALTGLDHFARMPTFVRSFAYATGPAYGLLLDESAPGWQGRLKGRPDLGELLGKALGIQDPSNGMDQARERATRYGWADLVQDETRREDEQRSRVARYVASLVNGPVLILPRAGRFNYAFNPNELIPLGEHGIVYPTLRATGSWGILDAQEGALMTEGDLRIPAPQDSQARPLKGPGWSLELAPGWRLDPGPRKGDFRLIPAPAPAADPAPSPKVILENDDQIPPR